MIRLILLLNILFIQSVFAGKNFISSSCESHAKNQYLERGDWDSDSGGARLWDFGQLTNKFNKGVPGKCDKETFRQAIADSREYWEHIEDEHKCPKSNHPECDKVKKNISYLNTCVKTYEEKMGENDEQAICFNDKAPVGKLSRDIAAISSKLADKPDVCATLPKDLKKVNPDNYSLTDGIKGCLINVIKGLVTGIKKFFEDIWEVLELGATLAYKFGSRMVSFLKAAYNGTLATFYAEMNADGSSFMKDLVNSLMSMPSEIYKAATSQVQQFQCMNNKGKTEYTCKSLAEVGADVLMGFLTGGANKAAAMSKLKKVIKPLDKVLNITSRGSSVAKSAITSAAKDTVTEATTDSLRRRIVKKGAEEVTGKAKEEVINREIQRINQTNRAPAGR